MQLLSSEVDQFRRLSVCVRDGFSAYRQYSYEYECCETIVVRLCRSSRKFYVFGVCGIQTYRIKFLTGNYG